MREKSNDFIKKADNPSNVLEIGPNEDFWTFLKSRVYEGGWKAETIQQIISRIKYCLKNLDHDVVHTLEQATKSRIDYVRRHGVVEAS